MVDESGNGSDANDSISSDQGDDLASESFSDKNESQVTPEESIHKQVTSYFESTSPDRDFGDPPSAEDIETQFFDLDPLQTHRIVEGYWLNKPWAYASILYDEAADKRRYRFFEPMLTDFEQYVRRDLAETIRHVLRNREVNSLEDDDSFVIELEEIVAEYAAPVERVALHKVFYYLVRDFTGYDVVDPLMHDPHIEDISCDGANVPVFVYHEEYQDLETNLVLESNELDSLVLGLAQRTNKHVSASKPQTSGNLPDGSRIQVTLDSDISIRGSNFTIRKFEDVPLTPIDLVEFGTFSLAEMAYLWLAIANNMSIMFVGPTASGKTTSMNAISLFLPPNGKVVSIEKVREVSIPHENWISYITRQVREEEGREPITMYDLLQSALHERPEYLLVGEIRTNPTVVRTFFQSIFTGHPGATTFHASTAQNAINRLTSDPLDINQQMVSALDLISVQHQVAIGDQEQQARRNISLSEIHSPDENNDTSELLKLFGWEPGIDSIEQSIDSQMDSQILQQIGEERGWDAERVLAELSKREEVLAYMVQSGITDYDEVVATFYQFYRNEEGLLEQIRDGTFEPQSLVDKPQ